MESLTNLPTLGKSSPRGTYGLIKYLLANGKISLVGEKYWEENFKHDFNKFTKILPTWHQEYIKYYESGDIRIYTPDDKKLYNSSFPNKVWKVVTYSDILTSALFVIDINNDVYVTGDNRYGQLGLTRDSKVPEIKTLTKVPDIKAFDIVATGYHTMLIDTGGVLYECGLRGNFSSDKFVKAFDQPVKQISGGNGHFVLLDSDNKVWVIGSNTYGQLGILTAFSTKIDKWTKLFIDDVVKISCGNNHTVFLKNDGSVWGCGDPSKGQLLVQPDEITSTMHFHTYGGDFPDVINTFKKVDEFTKMNITHYIKDIVCSNDVTLFIDNQSTAYGCGTNAYLKGHGLYQITSEKISKVACNDKYISVLTTKNQVITMDGKIDNNSEIKDVICGHTQIILIV